MRLKKIVSILLIFTFLLQTGSQLWILTAFYINRQYLSENVCINRFDQIPVCKASCVLDVELKQNQAQQQNQPDLKIKEITVFQQPVVPEPLQSFAVDLPDSYLTTGNPEISKGFYLDIFHPPSIRCS